MSAENSSELGAHLRASAQAMLAEAGARFERGDPGVLRRFLDSFRAVPTGSGFRHVPQAARRLLSDVTSRVPAEERNETGRAFLFAALLQALADALAAPAFLALPPRVMAHQLRHYERILTRPEPTRAACAIDDDLFLKDFGLASLRLIAAGSNLVDVNSGVGRSMLLKGGWRDLPRRLMLFARLGGFRPCFEIHAHKFYMDEFNEEGRNECYRCCAALYPLYPRVLGMIAGSWFYDPAIATISPRLAYLREVPERGGASVLFASFGEDARRNALAKSETRRRLYESGAYRPAGHVLVWPRAAQLAWARTHAGAQPPGGGAP